MVTRKELRARARATLVGLFDSRWMLCIGAALLVNLIMGGASSVFPVASLIIGGPIAVGMASFMLAMIRSREQNPSLGELFVGFSDFAGNLVTYLLVELYIFLWSLLFIVPGIVKGISYSMVYYIRHDHPEYTATQSIEESQRLMHGHKMEYFLLQLSFLGWMLLGLLCCGVGVLWVSAYQSAANAHFYQELKLRDDYARGFMPPINEFGMGGMQ